MLVVSRKNLIYIAGHILYNRNLHNNFEKASCVTGFGSLHVLGVGWRLRINFTGRYSINVEDFVMEKNGLGQ